MNEPNPRSRYWLSPGIDVPAEEEVRVLSASPRALRGFYYDRNAGEAVFVPPADFMAESPLWRIDVLDDITADVQRTRTHALVAYFRECSMKRPNVPLSRHFEAFRAVCERAGFDVPDELEALLVLDYQYRCRRL